MFCFQVRLIILMSDDRAEYQTEYEEVGRNRTDPGIKLIDYIFPTLYTDGTKPHLSKEDISKITPHRLATSVASVCPFVQPIRRTRRSTSSAERRGWAR